MCIVAIPAIMALAGAASTAATAAASVGLIGTTIAGVTTIGGISASTIGLVGGLVGAVGSGIGQMMQGQAQAKSDKYNAQIAANNEQQAENNATRAGQAGEQQAAMSEMKTRATVGAIAANQGAAGIDINKGSAVDVRSSATENGELDALTIRSNAAQEAYGYKVQGANFQAQSQLDTSKAGYDANAGYIGAGSTLLSQGGETALKLNNYNQYAGQQGIS